MVKVSTLLIVLFVAVGLTLASLVVGNWQCASYAGAAAPVCTEAAFAQLQASSGGNLQANVWRGFPFAYVTPGGLELLPLIGDIAFWFASIMLGWLLLSLLRIFVGQALDYNFER